MRGCLLDTNIIRYWFDGQCPQNRTVIERVKRLPEKVPLMVSAISLGEIEFGFRVRGQDDPELEKDLRRFIQEKLPVVLDITSTTRTYYGSLRAALFERYAPRNRRGKRSRIEQLTDPTSALELGIQENDVWIAAQALEHNLTLVSNDRLVKIEATATGLFLENWAEPGEFSIG